jgi:hypothetical protein
VSITIAAFIFNTVMNIRNRTVFTLIILILL